MKKNGNIILNIIPRAAVSFAALAFCAVCTACFGGLIPKPDPVIIPDVTAIPTEDLAPSSTEDFGEPEEYPLTGAAEYDCGERDLFSAFDKNTVISADEALSKLGEVMGARMPLLSVHIGEECGLPYCEGTDVYVHPDDFGSLGFIAAAAHAAGEYPDWVYRGAAYIAANGAGALNPVKLGAYLRGEDRINAIALLPVRFAPRFNNEQTLAANYRAAGGFFNYIKEKYGYIETGNYAEDKLGFVDSIGLAEDYDGRYEGLLDDCEVTFNYLLEDDYADGVLFPAVIESETYTLYAQPLTDCRNVNELEALLYKLEVGKQQMRSFIEEHADENLSVCTFNTHVTYYMLNTYGFSYAQGGAVVLRLEAGAILHETVHQWIMPHYYDHWYYEGLADFLAFQGGEGEDISFVHSMARLAFAHPDTYGSGGVADYNNTPASERVPGDEYTYDQSCSLIAYICETYTLDPILAVCGGYDFENDFRLAFGKSFETVVAEWREWLG